MRSITFIKFVGQGQHDLGQDHAVIGQVAHPVRACSGGRTGRAMLIRTVSVFAGTFGDWAAGVVGCSMWCDRFNWKGEVGGLVSGQVCP